MSTSSKWIFLYSQFLKNSSFKCPSCLVELWLLEVTTFPIYHINSSVMVWNSSISYFPYMPSFWCKSIKEFWHNDKLLFKVLTCEAGMQCIQKTFTSYAFMLGSSQQHWALCLKAGNNPHFRFLWPWLHWAWRWWSEKFDNIF
jgi:hypothetical protein